MNKHHTMRCNIGRSEIGTLHWYTWPFVNFGICLAFDQQQKDLRCTFCCLVCRFGVLWRAYIAYIAYTAYTAYIAYIYILKHIGLLEADEDKIRKIRPKGTLVTILYVPREAICPKGGWPGGQDEGSAATRVLSARSTSRGTYSLPWDI